MDAINELVETVVLSLVIFLLIRMVVQNYHRESPMMPNFQEGQFILVNKLAFIFGAPAPEVIVFHNPRNTNEDYINVIGLPGDTVEIMTKLSPLTATHYPSPMTQSIPAGYTFGPQLISRIISLSLGDNRPNSR